jgi:site-specific DNA-methyltransferase (adenine-specific)
MDANSIDSIVCDPPYEISFMSKNWDSTGIAYDPEFWALCLRVLKPGGHLVSFGACRTYHRIACAIEDAGFEIRDSLFWNFGSGFPKSLDISKAIDKAAGAEREVVGTSKSPFRMASPTIGNTLNSTQAGDTRSTDAGGYIVREHTAPATPEAQQWDGWGSALKPAHEPVVLARKPLAGTVAATVLEYGTGGLNVDGCRLPGGKNVPASAARDRIGQIAKGDEKGRTMDTRGFDPNVGRWPPNVLLSPETAAKLGDKASYFPVFDYGDEDRFFYAPKASREEREAGCEHLPGKTQAETVDREPGAPGGNNPRAGAGRENGKGAGVKVRNFHPT